MPREAPRGQPIQKGVMDARKREFVAAIWAAGLLACAVPDFNPIAAMTAFSPESVGMMCFRLLAHVPIPPMDVVMYGCRPFRRLLLRGHCRW